MSYHGLHRRPLSRGMSYHGLHRRPLSRGTQLFPSFTHQESERGKASSLRTLRELHHWHGPCLPNLAVWQAGNQRFWANPLIPGAVPHFWLARPLVHTWKHIQGHFFNPRLRKKELSPHWPSDQHATNEAWDNSQEKETKGDFSPSVRMKKNLKKQGITSRHQRLFVGQA